MKVILSGRRMWLVVSFSICVVCDTWACALCIHICACGRRVVAYMYVSTYTWRHKVDPRCVPSSLTTLLFEKKKKLSYWAQSFTVLARVANQFVLGIFCVFILSSELANGHHSWPMATKPAQLLFGFCGSEVWSSWSAPSTEQSSQPCDSLPPKKYSRSLVFVEQTE